MSAALFLRVTAAERVATDDECLPRHPCWFNGVPASQYRIVLGIAIHDGRIPGLAILFFWAQARRDAWMRMMGYVRSRPLLLLPTDRLHAHKEAVMHTSQCQDSAYGIYRAATRARSQAHPPSHPSTHSCLAHPPLPSRLGMCRLDSSAQYAYSRWVQDQHGCLADGLRLPYSPALLHNQTTCCCCLKQPDNRQANKALPPHSRSLTIPRAMCCQTFPAARQYISTEITVPGF
ncbi:hypothetical protein EDC01DRAFT_123814 [Geopyxis carbonaria]|nr:hypothetical protein EDC01DRAFT_123814 [Geopyxis carbonaria]